MASLIQNYVATQKNSYNTTVKPQVETPKKPKPDFDIERELNNRTFIKPLEGEGKLLNGNIFNAPAIMVKDAIYDFKAFKHAAKGKANDHELGKLNDVGLKLGGLAIAGYLFSKKQTPMTKGMEFVGLASFLASMAIWPKIAIQLPAYLIHGINVQKEYQDSFGRKKPFYQDPQFIPWDLYNDKQIQKIGDRMGVPKDIPNRRDAIQEKMKKIAIQNNTLWMMTAGFATPVMSALICNQTEPFLAKYLNNRENKKADAILSNFEAYSQKYLDKNYTQNIEKLLSKNADKPVTKELVANLASMLSEGFDNVTAGSIHKDLQEMLLTNSFVVDDETTKEISKNLKEKLLSKNYSEEFVNSVIPADAELSRLLGDSQLLGNEGENDLRQIRAVIIKKVKDNVVEYNKANPNGRQYDARRVATVINGNEKAFHPIRKALEKVHAQTFDKEVRAKIGNMAEVMNSFRAKMFTLNEYAVKKVGAAPETVVANYWNNISKNLLKTLGFTDKEIAKTHFDRNLMGEVLRGHIENIVSDDAKYREVMKKIIDEVATLDSQIKPSDISSGALQINNNGTAYETKVEALFSEFKGKIDESGLRRTAKAIAGNNGYEDVGTLKNIQKSYAAERMLGVKSSFYRLINTLDFYRRIAQNPNGSYIINGQYSREVKEELIELCKIITLQGHSSDSATKFYMLRNPNPATDNGPVEVKGGKIQNKYFGKTVGTDIGGDKYFYQNAMQLMFEEDLDPATREMLSKTLIGDEINRYRTLILDNIGSEHYFAKPNHKIRPANGAGSDLKFLLTGIAPDELFYKAGQQAFNTKKWLKIFGGFGAALLGVTVLAQFFFGKMPKYQQKADKK